MCRLRVECVTAIGPSHRPNRAEYRGTAGHDLQGGSLCVVTRMLVAAVLRPPSSLPPHHPPTACGLASMTTPSCASTPSRQARSDAHARTRVDPAHARDVGRVAPPKPANAADPFDPAYKFDDLDEFVRSAQPRGMEVLITLWGTPAWANGNKRPNHLPTSMADFQNFAKAVASRYSGRTPGTRSSASTGSGTSRTSDCSSARSSTRRGRS